MWNLGNSSKIEARLLQRAKAPFFTTIQHSPKNQLKLNYFTHMMLQLLVVYHTGKLTTLNSLLPNFTSLLVLNVVPKVSTVFHQFKVKVISFLFSSHFRKRVLVFFICFWNDIKALATISEGLVTTKPLRWLIPFRMRPLLYTYSLYVCICMYACTCLHAFISYSCMQHRGYKM